MASVPTGFMRLTSPAFAHKASIPTRYTCDGAHINPPLAISGVPKRARSLVLIMADPDAPVGTFYHWLLWNLPPETRAIAENSAPQAVSGTTGFNRTGYGGPCPPSGTHRYYFRLYALDVPLSLPEGADVRALQRAMAGHTLERAELMGTYHRK